MEDKPWSPRSHPPNIQGHIQVVFQHRKTQAGQRSTVHTEQRVSSCWLRRCLSAPQPLSPIKTTSRVGIQEHMLKDTRFYPRDGDTARLEVLGDHVPGTQADLTRVPLGAVQALLRSRLHRPASLHEKLLSQGMAQPTQ